jgi:hypothetical protein
MTHPERTGHFDIQLMMFLRCVSEWRYFHNILKKFRPGGMFVFYA